MREFVTVLNQKKKYAASEFTLKIYDLIPVYYFK